MIKAGFCNAPACIQKVADKKLKTLHSVWYARLVRRTISFLVRTPARNSIVKLINLNVPISREDGCIIVICHTPWKRLLVQWCLKENFGLVIGGGRWNDERASIQKQGTGIAELRKLISHLQLKGRIIATADVFNDLNNCPVEFLGNHYNSSLFAERLATLAKVPIFMIIPKLSNKSIDFISGPIFSTHGLKPKNAVITRQIISFFEMEIEQSPAIWSYYVK